MKILFNLYATKSDIQELMGGGRWNKVSKVFDECKKLENDPMNLRPNKVPSQLVFKVLGLNYSFAMRQYKETNQTQSEEAGELSN
jgi:hypothetical protein